MKASTVSKKSVQLFLGLAWLDAWNTHSLSIRPSSSYELDTIIATQKDQRVLPSTTSSLDTITSWGIAALLDNEEIHAAPIVIP